MKKFFLKTALLLIILLPVACEITLPYDNGNTNIDISVNALYTPDTTVSILVAKTLSPATANIYSKDPISNANVEMTVNDGQPQTLAYDDSTRTYISNYQCRPNDNIRLNITVENLHPAACEITVPNNPQIKILSFKKQYSPQSLSTANFDYYGSDTVVVCQLCIMDNPDETNYYRLKVKNLSDRDSISGKLLSTDIFSSNDMIFHDERISGNSHFPQKYFSNIFDDRLFNGKEHTFTVETRMRDGKNPYMVVELQALSLDFFNYLKNLEPGNGNSSDPFAESFAIPSNVTGGTGIVGALIPDRHIIPLR